MLKAAIVGYGGIAQAAHVNGWKTLEDRGIATLVAAFDISEDQFNKKLAINIGSADSKVVLNQYTDLEQMLENEDLDIIDICLPTHLHAQMAADLLRRGYNVQSEKPMARTTEQCDLMIAAAEESGSKLMIGQCLRFSDNYLFVKELIDSKKYGKPLSAVFRRMSSPPLWSSNNWLMDQSLSGGCLMDMHIHDLDIARYLFGEPEAVSCVTQKIFSGDDVAHSRLIYKDLAVTAIGDWSQQGVDFCADYRIAFEKATIILDAGVVTVYPHDGEPYKPELANEDMYMKELEYFCTVVVAGQENKVNTLSSARRSVALVEKLKESSEQNGVILKF